MSKIGEYVHYSSTNYMRYGTTRKDSSGAVSVGLWNKIRKNMTAKATKIKYNITDIKEIEHEYNTFRQAVTTNDPTKYKAVRDKIVELMIKKFNDVTEDTEFDFATGDLRNPPSQSAVDSAIKRIGEVKKTAKNTKVKYGSRAMKSIEDAYKMLATIPSEAKRKEIKASIDAAKTKFLEAIKISNEEIRKNNLTGIHHISEKTLIYADDYKAFTNAINTIFGFNSSNKLSSAKGTFEEYIGAATALAKEAAVGKSIDEIEKYIINNLEDRISKGGGNVTVGITGGEDMAKISQNAAKELKHSSFTVQDEQGVYSYKTTYQSEQKMDVSFTYDTKNNKMAALTIKNYNLYSGHPISLVTGSPLSTFLFNLGDINLTNHFLNIFTTHPQIESSFNRCRKIAEESLAYSLLWSAMSGKGVGKTEGFADIFVVKNNKSKDNTVKMWDIGSLINSIIKDKANLEKNLIINPKLENLWIENEWEGGPTPGALLQKRIAKLLLYTHMEKMSVSISPSILI